MLLACVVCACMAMTGCAISRKHVVSPAAIKPALESDEIQLLAAYNNQARAVNSVNAAVRMTPVGGSAYSGVIEQYHDVGGFILAARSATIRVIGQAPIVSKNIFDMVSDGRTFRIFIPSKNKFLVGSTSMERQAKNPIENLRPQHVLDALFWPELTAASSVLFEEFNAPPDRFYILTQVRPAAAPHDQPGTGEAAPAQPTALPSGAKIEIARKIWFDRADLHVARIQIYGPGGRLDSDINYSDWRTGSDSQAGPTSQGSANVLFPREIRIDRPQQDYQLALSITKLTLNSQIPADRFVLPQPPGTELVPIADDSPADVQPSDPTSSAHSKLPQPGRQPCVTASARDQGHTFVIGHIILGNVLHRPLRTLISVLAVGVEVALVILIVGLASGMLQETAKRIEGVGADIMLQPPSASVFLAFSGAPMPIRIGDRLRSLKYVQSVAPVLLQFNSSDGVEIIYGIDPESFREVSGGFVFLNGGEMMGPDDVLMDDWAAKSRHMNVGDTFKLLDHDFHVAGIVEHGKGARIFLPLATLQELSGSRDKASIFFLKCTRADHISAVMDEMHAILPGYEVRPLKDFMSLMTTNALPGLNTFINSMIALAVAIGFLVIFLSMYTTVIERTRDIGVLKSIGASNFYVVGMLLGETMAISAVGVTLGIGMSYAARILFLSAFPTLSILITPDWIIRAALIAGIGGLLGSSYPAWLAGRKDVVEALAYD